jgi:hypothetical protein
VAIAPKGAEDALRWQTDRPVQVESIAGVALRAFGDARHIKNFRSDGIIHRSAGAVAAGVGAIGLVAFVLLAIGVIRRPGPRELVLGSFAAVLVFTAFGKVVSPQYMIWVLALTALALAWRMYPLFAVMLAAHVLTFIEFPFHYAALTQGHPRVLALVGARDALLVLAVGLCVRELYAPGERAGARAILRRRPARAPA